MRRPQNHVTRAMDAARTNLLASPEGDGSYPYVPAALLERLERDFPPRCRGATEGEREHERYAGAADLVARLRYEHDRIADFRKAAEGEEPNLDAMAEEELRGQF